VGAGPLPLQPRDGGLGLSHRRTQRIQSRLQALAVGTGRGGFDSHVGLFYRSPEPVAPPDERLFRSSVQSITFPVNGYLAALAGYERRLAEQQAPAANRLPATRAGGAVDRAGGARSASPRISPYFPIAPLACEARRGYGCNGWPVCPLDLLPLAWSHNATGMGGSLGMPRNYGETPGSASPGRERVLGRFVPG
jgi:hypothetical protein